MPFCIAAMWQNFIIVFKPLRVSNPTIFKEWDFKAVWIWNCFWRIMTQLVRNQPRAAGKLKSTICFAIQLLHFPNLEDYWSLTPSRGHLVGQGQNQAFKSCSECHLLRVSNIPQGNKAMSSTKHSAMYRETYRKINY